MVNGGVFNRSATLVVNLFGYPRPVFWMAVVLASNENTGESLTLSAEQEARLRGHPHHSGVKRDARTTSSMVPNPVLT